MWWTTQKRKEEGAQIAVVDCTFLTKSGRHTYGLDWFYNGKTQRAEKGLELSVIGIVDIEKNTGYALSAQQTETGLSGQSHNKGQDTAAKGNRINFYLGHLAACILYFPQWVRYIVTDGFYSKYKWVTGVVQLGFHAIGKLRSDANLKFLYESPYQGRGARRHYDGKVNLHDHRRLEMVQRLEDGVYLYTAVVWSVSLKRKVRLAYLLKEDNGRRSYVVLFSTDLDIEPAFLYRCYAARFQIEFVFRDARQYTGLADCQARSPEAIDTHVNASLTALNLAKFALELEQSDADTIHFSLASFKRRALNEHLLDLFIEQFELEPTLIKLHPNYQNLLDYWVISP